MTDESLFEAIRELVAGKKYVIGAHASERLDERGILEWQAVAGLADGTVIDENPDAEPNPTVEVLEMLPDGAEFTAIWSLLRRSKAAKLVTVYFSEN